MDIERDAGQWMRALRLERYRLAELRRLRVGETFWIAHFGGPGVTRDTEGHCEAYIERVRGGYVFHAVWTLVWGKPQRTHVMTTGFFNLLPGNRLQFKRSRDVLAEKSFRLVCRYAAFICRHAREYGIAPLYLSDERRHKLWRGATVLQDGRTRHGVEGPVPVGLAALVEAAIGLGVLPADEFDEEVV